ncbi:MAG: hypothetical protein JWN18_491 [Parcubacteria group bacterium]|nr:hypothetical protein [Parcubacteria group bacterium]
MSKTSMLILLGVLTILSPFSGLPMAMRSFLTVVFGACVAIVGLTLRAHQARTSRAAVEAVLSQAEEEPLQMEPARTTISPI